MSLINKMLQDLDRREASTGPNGAVPPKQVRTVKPRTDRREWFWRTLAAAVLVAIGWVAWVAYQMLPRPLVTALAFSAAQQAPKAAVAPPSPPPAPAIAPEATLPAAEPAPAAPPAAQPSAPPAAQPSAPRAAALRPEKLRLEQSIRTPIVASAAAPKATEQPKLERRDIVGTAAERAENEFRYGAGVLKLGRSAEAEGRFAKALELDSRHRGARQALVAMQMERGQLEPARKLLQEGLVLEPAQPDFAVALARILVERKDYPGALAAMESSASAAADLPDYHVLRGTILQRLGRHGEAVNEYRAALQTQSMIPQAWVGLGISLEALNRRPEAADAFRHALAAGPTSAEVKAFAEQRVRALR